jgi:FKBP-type peptidyl-prolyl cis-trans isomerase SlyD
MIQKGSKVRIHYTLTVDGEKIESSQGGEPLSYTHGEGHIVPGLEEGLTGLAPGEKKEIQVSPEKAYGERDPSAAQEVPKTVFEEPDRLDVGGTVSGRTGDGQTFQARVAKIGADTVTLDLNHPLAGKTLDFQIEVVEVS